jgi:hypothetical protein
MLPDRKGLLILRAWTEQGSSEPLRVHFRVTSDVASGFQHETNLRDIDAVCDSVRRWLEGFADRKSP